MLSASGSENLPTPLQNDDIQSICTCLHRTGNEKGALRKGSFVRIKGLEPPRPKASDPKSDVATNYTISANIRTGTAKAGCKTGFRRCVKRVLSFAKLPENERNRAGLSAKITGSVPVLCKDKESKRQAKQIRACPSRLLSVGKDNEKTFFSNGCRAILPIFGYFCKLFQSIMPYKLTLVLTPKQAADVKYYTEQAARRAGVAEQDVALVRVVGRSIDARQRQPKVNLTLEVYADCEPQPAPVHFDYPSVAGRTEVVIVGSGPAGLFTALRLIERGYRPVILERGRDVSARKRDIAQINRNGAVDPDSNYAFGEGGAGTFSDGKLFTRSKKRGDYNKALQTLVFHGATPEILYESHPHIGTDKLPRVISNIRRTILEAGGSFVFDARVTDVELHDDRVKGVWVGDTLYEGAAVVLATGHSARDIYELLHRRGVRREAKPFAMGVRIEHPQALIDSIQYHCESRGEYLPAASYSLVSQEGGRGVYSFCMCPGGFIVPAMTDAAESVVNGMSPSGRNSVFANSGLVTEVRLADFEHLRAEWGELAGLKFQQQFERLARQYGGEHQIAPAQRVADFVAGRASGSLPRTSYIPGVVPSRLDKWMPGFIASSLRAGIATFGRRMRGFLTNEALVVGVESRTSTPVRIPRDAQTLMHPEVAGLFPAGEGAGYAGGIISAALDGERIADAVVNYLKK